MKKFNDGEIFVSTLKVYPKVKFFGYNGIIYYNKTSETSVKLNDFLPSPFGIPEGAILLESEEALITEGDDFIIIE